MPSQSPKTNPTTYFDSARQDVTCPASIYLDDQTVDFAKAWTRDFTVANVYALQLTIYTQTLSSTLPRGRL